MAERREVPGKDRSIVEYDEDGNIVLTGTDIPASKEDIERAEQKSPSGGA